MVNRDYILNRLKSRSTTIDEFNFDKLQAPPLYSILTPTDTGDLYTIAHSIKYSAQPQKKTEMIKQIMAKRGFRKLSAGTNRLVFAFLEDNGFVAKIAYDDIGRQDNPAEFRNQFILKPFCAKTFEIDPTGTVAFSERVNPITNREEFITVADDIFYLITEVLIGEYVLADFGARYFLNYGIRNLGSFGPVILDYAYLYKVDPKKLYCSKPDPFSKTGYCDGEIDYDDGFNFLVCKKCGAMYKAKELELNIEKTGNIVVKEKGGMKMKIMIKGGNLGTKDIKEVGNDAPARVINVTRKPLKTGKKESSNKDNNMKAVNGVVEKTIKPVKPEEVEKKDTSNVVAEAVVDTNRPTENVDIIAAKDKMIEDLTKDVDYLKEDLLNLGKERDHALDLNGELNKKIRELEKAKQALEDDLREATENGKLNVEMANLQKKIEELEDEKYSVECELRDTEIESDDYKRAYENADNENEKLNVEIVNLQKRVEELEQENIELKNRLENVEEEDDESDADDVIEFHSESSVDAALSTIKKYLDSVVQMSGLLTDDQADDLIKLFDEYKAQCNRHLIEDKTEADYYVDALNHLDKFVAAFDEVESPDYYMAICTHDNMTKLFQMYIRHATIIKNDGKVSVIIYTGIPDENDDLIINDKMTESIYIDNSYQDSNTVVEFLTSEEVDKNKVLVDELNDKIEQLEQTNAEIHESIENGFRSLASQDIVDDIEEDDDTDDEDEEEMDKFSDEPIWIHGITKNIKEMYPRLEDRKVIILEDSNGEFVTGGNNSLIAIDRLDNQSLSEIEVVSSSWFSNVADLLEANDSKLEAKEEIPTGSMPPVGVNGVQ